MKRRTTEKKAGRSRVSLPGATVVSPAEFHKLDAESALRLAEQMGIEAVEVPDDVRQQVTRILERRGVVGRFY